MILNNSVDGLKHICKETNNKLQGSALRAALGVQKHYMQTDNKNTSTEKVNTESPLIASTPLELHRSIKNLISRVKSKSSNSGLSIISIANLLILPVSKICSGHPQVDAQSQGAHEDNNIFRQRCL